MSDEIKQSRHDIYTQSSSASAAELCSLLKKNVYAPAEQWKWFLNLLLPVLGISFIVCGVIFFFAYNWDDIGRFAKFIGVGVLLVGSVGLAVFCRCRLLIRQLLLLVGACMVGVLFAVYGQEYQTGADSYELFLNWVLGITVWVVVGRFAPLWLLWIVLINLSIHFYSEQRMDMFDDISRMVLAFQTLFLAGCVVVTEVLCVKGMVKKRPWWFVNVLILAACIFDVYYVIDIMWEDSVLLSVTGLVVNVLVLGGGFIWGWVKRSLFYIAISAFMVLILFMLIWIRILGYYFDEFMMFYIGGACVAGTTAIIVVITRLKKLWDGK